MSPFKVGDRVRYRESHKSSAPVGMKRDEFTVRCVRSPYVYLFDPELDEDYEDSSGGSRCYCSIGHRWIAHISEIERVSEIEHAVLPIDTEGIVLTNDYDFAKQMHLDMAKHIHLDMHLDTSCCGSTSAPLGCGWEIKKDKPNIMKRLNNMMKRLLDADTQTLVKAGYINGDLELTDLGRGALIVILFDVHKSDLVAEAAESLKEEEEKGKGGLPF